MKNFAKFSALTLITMVFLAGSNAHAGMADLVSVSSCAAAGIGGVVVAAKTVDALKIKNGVAEAAIILGTSTAACAGAAYVAEPFGERLDGFPSQEEVSSSDNE
ncbi:MAG: hypothetical protein ACXWQO_11955 [Bdellovibrionota bacterium]